MEQPIAESIQQAQDHRSHITKSAKRNAMGAIATGLLVLTWWFLRDALFVSGGTAAWTYTVIAVALWVSTVTFYALSHPSRTSFFIYNALGLAAFLAIMPRDIYVFAGGIIFFLMNMWFQRRVWEELTNQLNFSFRRAIGNSQAVMTYALLVLSSFLVYSNVRADFQTNKTGFYQKLAETAVSGVPYLSQDKSKYNLSQTVNEYFRKQAQEQFPSFNQVSSDQQELLMDQIRSSFVSQFGVDADPNTSLRIALTQVISQRLQDSLGRFEKFFPLLFTVFVFGVMRTFSFVFNWVVLGLSWFLFRILLVSRFFKIGKQTVEVEKLEI